MASGSCQGCEEEDEETLKKLIVRLNNVQEGKQIETLVQILEDMLVFTYADHGNESQGNSLLRSPPASFLQTFSLAFFRVAQTWAREKPQTVNSLGQKGAENCREVLRSLLLLSPPVSSPVRGW